MPLPRTWSRLSTSSWTNPSFNMKCRHLDCDKEATHYPKICVPAGIVPVEKCPPLTIIVGLDTCLDHAQSFDATDFINRATPDGKAKIKSVFTVLSNGRPPANFMRMYVDPILKISEEAQQFDGKRQIANGPTEPVPTVN